VKIQVPLAIAVIEFHVMTKFESFAIPHQSEIGCNHVSDTHLSNTSEHAYLD